MGKKRFTAQFSKPQSTTHPSLSSRSTAGPADERKDGAATVNELISNMRLSKITTPADQKTAASMGMATSTLPPHLRRLLSQPDRPPPRQRNPGYRDRRYDINGRPVPPGPPPPPSWLSSSIYADPSGSSTSHARRDYPCDLDQLPAGATPSVRSGTLQAACLKKMANEWDVFREYEMHNLACLPTGLRMSLLSYLAVYGPEEGVGIEGLKLILQAPLYETAEEDWESNPLDNNADFYRLDLSGAMGRSVSFKQLTSLVHLDTPIPDSSEEAWETSIPVSLSVLPRLTHLSLSHPAPHVSWRGLLAFAKSVPTITHLSLAYWPKPTLTPNSSRAVMSSSHMKDIQYGGTGLYSHSLDDDYSEAACIFKRLASLLYGLEYLDLTGCSEWWQGLRWDSVPWSMDLVEDAVHTHEQFDVVDAHVPVGIDWAKQLPKLKTLVLKHGYASPTESSPLWEMDRRDKADVEREKIETHLKIGMRRGEREVGRQQWVDVLRDLDPLPG